MTTGPEVVESNAYAAIDETNYPPITGDNSANTAAVAEAPPTPTRYFAESIQPGNDPLAGRDPDYFIPLDQNANWFKTYWRPAIAWQYFAVCLYDFILGPLFQQALYISNPEKYVQWAPLTLQYNGFYHISMGVVLGIYTWVRSKEKDEKPKV